MNTNTSNLINGLIEPWSREASRKAEDLFIEFERLEQVRTSILLSLREVRNAVGAYSTVNLGVSTLYNDLYEKFSTAHSEMNDTMALIESRLKERLSELEALIRQAK